MDALPHWEPGVAAVLCVAGPHAIPVSTAVRAGDRRVLLGLGGRRETLERLRREPAVALCVLAEGMAFTAYAEASVLRDALEAAPKVAAVELHVRSVQDHLADGRTEMLGAASWTRPDPADVRADDAVVAELTALARGSARISRSSG